MVRPVEVEVEVGVVGVQAEQRIGVGRREMYSESRVERELTELRAEGQKERVCRNRIE
jgi:hypothetical protein